MPDYDGDGISDDLDITPAGGNYGIIVTPYSGLITTEAGDQDSFTVVLESAPTAEVRIDLSSSDTSEGVQPVSLAQD